MWTAEERLNYIYAFVQFDMKDIRLDFWQDAFIKSKARYSCILKSRRTGFSFATGLKGIAKGQDPDRSKYVKQFVSYNESDAVEKSGMQESFTIQYQSSIKNSWYIVMLLSLSFLIPTAKQLHALYQCHVDRHAVKAET